MQSILVITSLILSCSVTWAQLPRNWVNVGGGISGGAVHSLAVEDIPGPGHILYAGGAFTSAGTVEASMVAQWNGIAWGRLGNICCGAFDVNAMKILDLDGGGPLLYAGGTFLDIPGDNPSARYIMTWDGIAPAPLSDDLDNGVAAITSFDFGAGEELVAAGANIVFTESSVARFDGANWIPLGDNMVITSPVAALAVHDSTLYAGGTSIVENESEPPGPALHLAQWDSDDDKWVAAPGNIEPMGPITSMVIYEGDLLVAANEFMVDGEFANSSLMRWDGSAWSSMDLGPGDPPSDMVVASDSLLYVAGDFSTIGTPCCPRVALWDGTEWTGLGAESDPDGDIHALATAGEGDCVIVYAGGGFQEAIAKYTPEPIITGHPQGLVRCVGQAAAFSVTALGGALTFQWFKDGNLIGGANGPTFLIPAVAAANAGVYTVLVSNPCGTTLSFSATLVVVRPVVLIAHPVGQSAYPGTTAVLRVVVEDPTATTYQWRRNSNNLANGGHISGATADSLIINPATHPEDTGSYDCVITNACGSVTSNTAILTVTTSADALEEVPTLVRMENIPNPFHTATTIRYALPSAAHVRMHVFDLAGRRVQTLLPAAWIPAGVHDVEFRREGLASGVYFCRMEALGETVTRRMVVID